MKYIPADKLIAEIERQQRKLTVLSLKGSVNTRRDCSLQNGVYDSILTTINSLQQESVDKNVFIQKAIQWMYKTVPIDDVLSVEMIEDFKKTMMED